MESLDPVSYDAFIALRDSFKFYLYHVFIWFGVNVTNFFELKESEFTSTMDKLAGFDNNTRRSRSESAADQKKRTNKTTTTNDESGTIKISNFN